MKIWENILLFSVILNKINQFNINTIIFKLFYTIMFAGNVPEPKKVPIFQISTIKFYINLEKFKNICIKKLKLIVYN